MFRSLEVRADRLVERLLRGRRLPKVLRNSPEAEIARVAATLASGRVTEPRMSARLRRRLEQQLAAEAPIAEVGSAVTRRTALGAAAGVLAGALGVAAFEGLRAPAVQGPAAVVGGIMKPGGGRWIQVASLNEISDRPVRVVAGDLVGYLFRSGKGVKAVSAVCSHLPCALDWKPEGGTLNCPCHNVDFTTDGLPLRPDYDVAPLQSIQVRVVGGVVEVLSS